MAGECEACGAKADDPCPLDYTVSCERVGKAPEAGPGLPSGYDGAKHDRELVSFFKHGWTINEIASHWGIRTETMYQWQHEHDSFADAWRKGEELSDTARSRRVELALFRRAIGYEYTEERPGREGPVTVQLHQPADTKAAETWLHNRDPDRWKPPAQRNLNINVDNPLAVLFEEMRQKPQRIGPFADGALNQLENLNEQYSRSPSPADGAARQHDQEQELDGAGDGSADKAQPVADGPFPRRQADAAQVEEPGEEASS